MDSISVFRSAARKTLEACNHSDEGSITYIDDIPLWILEDKDAFELANSMRTLRAGSKDDINKQRQDLGSKRTHPAKIDIIGAVLREFPNAVCTWTKLKDYEEHRTYFNNTHKATISQKFDEAGGWHILSMEMQKQLHKSTAKTEDKEKIKAFPMLMGVRRKTHMDMDIEELD